MLEFINFTVEYFAVRFALWLLYLTDGINCDPELFWDMIDADPHTDAALMLIGKNILR